LLRKLFLKLMRHSLFKQLKEVKHAIIGYPDFVYAKHDNFELNGIPVFLYHTIDAEVFESHLIYLKENNYQTLDVNEFYKILTRNDEQKSKKLVLLTIDDARSSVWRYAYPLLKKYQMHATVFVIPGVTEESIAYRENLQDVWSGKTDLKRIHEVDPNDDTLCTWQEIIEMYNSGFVNIESHTLFHREVFVSKKIVDFISPKTSNIPYNFSGSAYFSEENVGKKFDISDYDGLPIFESSPLMLAGPKLNISPSFLTRCLEIYNQNVNKGKQNKDWRKEIQAVVNNTNESLKYFRFENDSKKDVVHDLTLAREIIRGKLNNKAGNHLCLPWTIGNNSTIQICKEIGITSCFWGLMDNKKINNPGDDPYYVTRLKNDFIFRLPGKLRKSFFSIYNYKIKRRLSGEKVY